MIYKNVGSSSNKGLFEEAYELWDDDDSHKYIERGGQWIEPESGKVIGQVVTGADLQDPTIFKRAMEMASELDTEGCHIMGDELMGMLLRHLGYGEAIDVFNAMGKWYS